jgi:peptidoglycan/xylan/chitin deacetylase (PgdA/CDA1 family)
MVNSLPILTFHAVDDLRSIISFPPQLFEHGMARLHDKGYRTLSLLELIDCMRSGAPFPDRSFVITFDDGYRSVYQRAFPILQRYGFSATIFLTVGEVGYRMDAERLPSLCGHSMLAWDEIKEMQRWGINFGAHTLTHPDLTRLPSNRVKAEVCGSQAIIEDALGAPVSCFAYPYGCYNRRVREMVREHFVCACSDKLGLVHGGSNPFTIERIDTYYLRRELLFGLISGRFLNWYIRARNVPRQIRRSIQRALRPPQDVPID